ncbi:MAG: hypothetical protein AB7P76_06825 [Candidatus Melainabacteria bacterium]
MRCIMQIAVNNATMPCFGAVWRRIETSYEIRDWLGLGEEGELRALRALRRAQGYRENAKTGRGFVFLPRNPNLGLRESLLVVNQRGDCDEARLARRLAAELAVVQEAITHPNYEATCELEDRERWLRANCRVLLKRARPVRSRIGEFLKPTGVTSVLSDKLMAVPEEYALVKKRLGL